MNEAASRRLHWIDFLRGLAVIGMIEAHVVDAFLNPADRTGWGFGRLNQFNGWVVPIFLFLAGLLQGRWVRQNWASPRPAAVLNVLPQVRRRLRYLGTILLLGYALQIHWLTWADGGQWMRSLGQIHVLHCLAVSLAGLLVGSQIARGRISLVNYEVLVGACGLLAVLTAPSVWQWVGEKNWPTPFTGYLTTAHGSLFPLLPWLGYVAAGSLASRWIERPNLYWWGFAGCILLVPLADLWVVAESWLQPAHPSLFLSRLGMVFLLCFLAGKLSRWLPQPFFTPILWCGRHSLTLYVVHLTILYGGLGLQPLASWLGRDQSPSVVWGLFFFTLATTCAVGWLLLQLWAWACQRRPLSAKN